jgi:hypothetical protein
MARRIMMAVMALKVALLGVIAVPLGLITAGQDRRDFQSETFAAAATLANVAEERLSDRSHGLPMTRSTANLDRSGDQLSVYDKAGARQGGTAAFPSCRPAWCAAWSRMRRLRCTRPRTG